MSNKKKDINILQNKKTFKIGCYILSATILTSTILSSMRSIDELDEADKIYKKLSCNNCNK
jgi:hypothetical protein